jgi:predicted NAD/FAD-binding protein
VFEAAQQVGGHTHTVDVDVGGHTWAVDCGFIVYNERNYPLFSKRLDQLAVPTQPPAMSFSVRMQHRSSNTTGHHYGNCSFSGVTCSGRPSTECCSR